MGSDERPGLDNAFLRYIDVRTEVQQENQASYLPLFDGCSRVVDLGCGDGDFVELLQKKGIEALGVMERHLEGCEFFAAGRYTIADIALYAYTHVAGEGGFDLSAFPNVERWLERVREQPGHVPITHAEGLGPGAAPG